jgi:DNA-binding transcriptional ArsR family regulator
VDEVLHRLSTLFQALGNGIRLEILRKLQEESANVSSLAEEVDRPINAVSRHLRILRDNDLVESNTEGRSRVYNLKRPDLVGACFALKSFLERSPE